jgi:uncharacterized protein YprB with RNaseH-like and TPR domain
MIPGEGSAIPRRRRDLVARIEALRSAKKEPEPPSKSPSPAGMRRAVFRAVFRHSSEVDTPRPRIPPPPDVTELEVDEKIDPATAPSDHFSSDFPPRCPFDERSLFLDLETTGLTAAERIALAGTLRPEGGALRLRQRFAFDAADERLVLEGLLVEIQNSDVVITYNGRSFDLPFLARRLRWHRLPELPEDLRHIDLLLEVRRRHRREWPDCSLATAEERLLGKQRTGPDVPGREVPRRFADVREGAPVDLLVPVTRHNRIDLTSLVALHLQLGVEGSKIEH